MPFFRRWMKARQPEGIPWPGSLFYNWLSSGSIFQRHYELVAGDVSRHCSAGRLLDVGTGPGWLLIKLQQAAAGMQLAGVDISPAMVAKARQNIEAAGLSAAVDLQEAPAARLPFADKTFDAVVSTCSLHHWQDAAACLDEVHRVLKPGGCALMYDLVKHTPKEAMDEAARTFGRLRVTLLWLHSFEEPFYDPQELEALAAATKFREGRTKFVGILCGLVLRKPG